MNIQLFDEAMNAIGIKPIYIGFNEKPETNKMTAQELEEKARKFVNGLSEVEREQLDTKPEDLSNDNIATALELQAGIDQLKNHKSHAGVLLEAARRIREIK